MRLLETRRHVHGPWRVTQIIESEGPFVDPAQLFRGVALDDVRKACPAGAAGRIAPDGMLVLATQVILVQKGELDILIDMGSGNGKERPQEPWWHQQTLPFLETLEDLGVSPGAVDYVLLTHLHNDHVGFATTRRDGAWVPTFPNARYVMSPADWEHFAGLPSESRHPSLDDSVRPLLAADVVTFCRPGDEIAGLRAHGSSAHTPGHLLFEAPDAGVWFVGDLIHHPASIARPEWPSSDYDFAPHRVEVERKEYLGRFAESGAVIYAAHIGDPYWVERTDDGRFAGSIASDTVP